MRTGSYIVDNGRAEVPYPAPLFIVVIVAASTIYQHHEDEDVVIAASRNPLARP